MQKELSDDLQRLIRPSQKKPAPKKKPENMKVIPIGGLDEIGKNMTVLEYQNQILIVDCGMTFPEDEMFGVDVVIPDLSYVVENAKRVKGLIITHGHEDHIGAVPFLLEKADMFLYTAQGWLLDSYSISWMSAGLTGDLKADKRRR